MRNKAQAASRWGTNLLQHQVFVGDLDLSSKPESEMILCGSLEEAAILI